MPTYSNRISVVVLALLTTACSVAQKGPRLDPFAAINPFQKFDPLAPPSPLAARVVAQFPEPPVTGLGA